MQPSRKRVINRENCGKMGIFGVGCAEFFTFQQGYQQLLCKRTLKKLKEFQKKTLQIGSHPL